MRLSLLRSPLWPDPTADRGKHSIEYSLYPHPGTWKEANTVAVGYEYNNPLIVVTSGIHKGRLPSSGSFLQLGPPNLVLTVMKKAEDSDAWIVQWYETSGEDSEAVLWLPQIPKKVVMSNFMEEDGTAVATDGHMVRVQTKKNSVVTLKITYECRFSKIILHFFDRQARQEVMSIKDYNILGVLGALSKGISQRDRFTNFVSGKSQDYLLEIAQATDTEIFCDATSTVVVMSKTKPQWGRCLHDH